MTPEARLDRLERIAMLLIRAGDRARKQFREQLHEQHHHHDEQLRDHDNKITYLIDLQIENEAKFSRNEERFARNEERFTRNEERFAKLVESQAGTDRRLNSLIEIINEGRNGASTPDS
jgi:hypothetical protein